jgi:two-component system, cell cycle response regulator
VTAPRPQVGQERTGDTDYKITELASDHESMATLLASGGQWRLAYEHLRAALELHRAEDNRDAGVRVPEQWRREVDRLRQESLRDSLTDSYNRRYLDQTLVGLLTERADEQVELAVALVDLDWFKRVNDTFGHLVGDRVLRLVVELLCAQLPPRAFCARYGGEEFALVLPGMPAEAAVTVCEAARSRVENHPWHELAAGLRVTVSCGVAHETTGTDIEHQLRCADTLLYAAKQSGRNAVAYRSNGRVRLAGPAAGRRGVAQLAAPAATVVAHPMPTAGV